MKHIVYIALIIISCSNIVFAQGPTFSATVSKTQVGTGEEFEIEFSLNSNGERFEPPAFNGFQVLSGPNMSQNMTMVNGNTTVSFSYSYVLSAGSAGQFTIGPASILVNGRRLTTRPVTIKVIKGQPPPRGQQRRQQQFGDDDEPVDASLPADLSKSIFIRAIADKKNVYLGQQLLANYRIYTRVSILENQPDKTPELDGFWSQDLNPQHGAAQWRTEIYNGSRYNVADIKQTVLFPERSGNLLLDPLAMTFVVRQQAPPRNVMEQFFGGSFRDVKIKVKSQPVNVHVKELPVAGKPIDFSGAVGAFTMQTSVDKTALESNQSLNYTVKISGAGNIKLFTPLTVNFPSDFEKYDPKVTDTINPQADKVVGNRNYTYLVIPKHQGHYTIEPAKFTYFNPVTERYITLTGNAFNIEVARGKNEANVSALTVADQHDAKMPDKDIRRIKTGDLKVDKAGDHFFGSVRYYLLLLLGPLLFAGAFAYRKWDKKNNSDLVKVKSRKASKVAARHLSNAKHQMAMTNTATFYEAVFKGLYGYLSDKLSIPYSNLDKDVIADALANRAVKQTTINELEETLNFCNMARFAPVKGISEVEVYEKAKNVIDSIEDEL